MSLLRACSVHTLCIWCCLCSSDPSLLQGHYQSITSSTLLPRKLDAVLLGLCSGCLVLKVMIKSSKINQAYEVVVWPCVTQTLGIPHSPGSSRGTLLKGRFCSTDYRSPQAALCSARLRIWLSCKRELMLEMIVICFPKKQTIQLSPQQKF